MNDDADGSSQHVLNQYTILEEIGRGSYGAVHRAVDQYGNAYVRGNGTRRAEQLDVDENTDSHPRHRPSKSFQKLVYANASNPIFFDAVHDDPAVCLSGPELVPAWILAFPTSSRNRGRKKTRMLFS